MTKYQRLRKRLGDPTAERKPVLCLRTPNGALHLRCAACAEEPPVIHQPIRNPGKFCAGCCPCCSGESGIDHDSRTSLHLGRI